MAKVIMIQGTMSGAGKSLLTAGLCRIFREDGYRVAPFKSQNMALNSFITKEGLEMGRAQAVQAMAAGREPSVHMNPILLKPTSDTGSQVIVNGEVQGTMSAREYFAYKKSLIPQILEAYRKLAADSDIIVVEGAGSPAEINLKQNDIVNMGLAELLDAPVLLAGDIDRGGVFAQLYGTVALLEVKEQERIKGLIINKFRGDVSILEPGIAMLEERTGKPVLGTVPMLSVDIEEEDSLSERLEQAPRPEDLDIAVIRFPRISNYTDLAPLEYQKGVSVRYVKRPEELGIPDMVILPGSKNTMADLAWFRESGLEARVLKLQQKGTPLLGICGGYQMMGEEIRDPEGVEEGGRIRGMGLLPLMTIFRGEKTRTRVEGKLEPLSGLFAPLSGCRFEGYEIHMGETVPSRACRDGLHCLAQAGRHSLGYEKDGVLGTYLHGFFDSGELTDALLSLLAKRKGVERRNTGVSDFRTYQEMQYRKLAKGLREALDMDAVYRILEKGER